MNGPSCAVTPFATSAKMKKRKPTGSVDKAMQEKFPHLQWCPSTRQPVRTQADLPATDPINCHRDVTGDGMYYVKTIDGWQLNHEVSHEKRNFLVAYTIEHRVTDLAAWLKARFDKAAMTQFRSTNNETEFWAQHARDLNEWWDYDDLRNQGK